MLRDLKRWLAERCLVWLDEPSIEQRLRLDYARWLRHRPTGKSQRARRDRPAVVVSGESQTPVLFMRAEAEP